MILHGLIELRFGNDREHVLQIETEFLIAQSDGPQQHVPVGLAAFDTRGPLPFGMDHLARLWGSEILTATASADGDLTISFTDGRCLIVRHDEKYEAWNITGPKGTLVSLAGGGLG